MNIKNLSKGLQIMEKYSNTNQEVTAEHFVIYVSATDLPLSFDDLVEVIELGWIQRLEDGFFKTEGKFDTEDYNVAEPWALFL